MPGNSAKISQTRRLAVFALGFLRQPRIGRILALAGWKLQHFHVTRLTNAVGVWGRKPVSVRGLRVSARTGLPLLNIEDAFLRSLHPGTRFPPLGLLLDERALHFDCSQPSELEDLLASYPLDDPELLRRARDGIAFLRMHALSKFNDWVSGPLPEPGYALVVDQTLGDAAVDMAGASADSFASMLAEARKAHPDKQIVIRSHPLTARGLKKGHFGPDDCRGDTLIHSDPVNPWELLDRAAAVYCVSSQLGFEAILAGHKPVVFGQPFYSGWGLTEDRQQNPRRGRVLTTEQLFAAAMLIYPKWYDPYHDRLGQFEDVASALAAQARAWRQDVQPSVCTGMKPWKHKPIGRFLATKANKPVFIADQHAALRQAKARKGRLIVWASAETQELRNAAKAALIPLIRMEDGFLRSVGLGAELRPAASLVLDDLGIYFDPTRPSRLETQIASSHGLPPRSLERAAQLRKNLIEGEVSKYNIGASPSLPANDDRKRILVPGQVEDDASIRKGCSEVRTNLELLRWTREANPEAFVIYKPHPDIEAGLRDGAVATKDLAELADLVAEKTSIASLLAKVDEVWTMTSLAGFEALIRGCRVHCLGMPFYAGWGLTEDHGQTCDRRQVRPSLDQLTHAVLIDYPRYFDPVSGLACPPEIIVERLAARDPEISRNPSGATRLLAKLQSRFSRFAYLWRR